MPPRERELSDTRPNLSRPGYASWRTPTIGCQPRALKDHKEKIEGWGLPAGFKEQQRRTNWEKVELAQTDNVGQKLRKLRKLRKCIENTVQLWIEHESINEENKGCGEEEQKWSVTRSRQSIQMWREKEWSQRKEGKKRGIIPGDYVLNGLCILCMFWGSPVNRNLEGHVVQDKGCWRNNQKLYYFLYSSLNENNFIHSTGRYW